MEVVDTLIQASEVSNTASMKTYNFVFITTVLSMNLLFALLLFIAFKIAQKKNSQKIFFPLLISLILLSLPIFSGLNLWPIAWIPKLSTPYDLMFKPDVTKFEAFSSFYYEWVPSLITIIYGILIVFFIQYLYKQNYFNKIQRVLLFVPFVNHFLIARYFLKLNISLLSKIMCLLLIFVSCGHWFYRTIGLILLIYGYDTYKWYFNTFLGCTINETSEEVETYSYSMFGDYSFHFNMSLIFVSALCMIPVYFILNKMKTEVDGLASK